MESYGVVTDVPSDEFHDRIGEPLSALGVTESGLDAGEARVERVLVEVQAFEDISEPLQVVKDEEAFEEDDVFKTKRNTSLLVHCTDGIRFVNLLVTDASLKILRHLSEGAKWLLTDIDFYSNTLILQTDSQAECVYNSGNQLLPENKQVLYTGLLAKPTEAPSFVYFEDRHQSEEIQAKKRAEAAKMKGSDFSDVVWARQLTGDLNIQEKNFVKQMAKAGFRRKVFG